MSTKTTTSVTHHHVQNSRRKKFVEDWRPNWRTIVRVGPDKTAKVVRIHMFDSLLKTMRVLADPLVLFEDSPNHIRDQQARDVSTIEWPALERPTWP